MYKTQLKNETIVDVNEEQRKKAARLFRGVDGDSSRKGELFGIANLFRFKDGTFMPGTFFPQGDQSRDFHRYGGGVFNMESLVSAAQASGAEGLEAIVGGNELEDLVEYADGFDEDEEDEGVQDLVGLTENGTLWIDYLFLSNCFLISTAPFQSSRLHKSPKRKCSGLKARTCSICTITRRPTEKMMRTRTRTVMHLLGELARHVLSCPKDRYS